MFQKAFFAAATVAFAAGAAQAQSTDTGSWSGPYAGLHAGYGFDDGQKLGVGASTQNTYNAIGSGVRPRALNQDRSGFLGGGQAGYNYQIGKWVLGGEGDFSYMDSRGTSTYNSPVAGVTVPAGSRTLVKSDVDWMGSARARVGYAVSDQGMFYATGGYAFGRVKGRAEFDGANSAVNYAGSHSYLAQGWIAGAGLEFRPFTQGMWSKVSFGLEGTYYDLGRSHIYATQKNVDPGLYVVGVSTRGYNGAFKINYRF